MLSLRLVSYKESKQKLMNNINSANLHGETREVLTCKYVQSVLLRKLSIICEIVGDKYAIKAKIKMLRCYSGSMI